MLDLMQAVTAAANEADSVDDALRAALTLVAEHASWPVGHAYLVSGETHRSLISSGIWHLDDEERFGQWREETEHTEFDEGVGTVGEVLANGKPSWVADISNHPGFVRSEPARAAGLKSTFGFPVLSGHEVTAVLEFFSTNVEQPDENLLQAMVTIGTQLGRVFERERARRMLEEREAALREKSAELERSNADLEQFAYVASHDLQEPLRMVSSYVQLLARRYRGKLDNDADDFIGYAVEGAARMQSLIRDLLTFSRVGRDARMNSETVNVSEVVEVAVDNLQKAVEEADATVLYEGLPEVEVIPPS